MDQKRGKGRLHSIARATLLGDGMLERARATTLGLLGVAGAVGLAMIALVFNQGWPLVAGGPVPPLPHREQAVAGAKAVSPLPHGRAVADAAPPRHHAGGDAAGAGQTPTAENGSTQAPSGELVVVPATPTEQQGGAPSSPVHTSPPPAKPKPAPARPTRTTEQPPPSSPAPAPAPAPASEPAPPATVSEAPESSVPPWSSGKGHAYGRSGREDED